MSSPVRQTALYHKHLALQATMVESEGWLLPQSYAGADKELDTALKSVGICDSSADVKVDVRGASGEVDGFLRQVLAGGVIGRTGQVSAYPTSTGNKAIRYVCRLASDRSLIVLRPTRVSRASPLDAEIDAPKNQSVYLTNVTSALAGITVFGPAAPRVLSRLSSLDLSSDVRPSPSCTEGAVAGVQCAVVRSDAMGAGGPVDLFDLYFGRGYAEFVWDALSEAGHDLGVTPVGTAARARMER
jgi:glycine cleavage system aminomethyltransferase T